MDTKLRETFFLGSELDIYHKATLSEKKVRNSKKIKSEQINIYCRAGGPTFFVLNEGLSILLKLASQTDKRPALQETEEVVDNI